MTYCGHEILSLNGNSMVIQVSHSYATLIKNKYASQKPMIESNDWHQVYFDWDDVRDGCLDTMQHQFELLWSDAGRPVEAALFLNRLVTGGRHIYFSPVASRIASVLLERYVALKCDEPSDLGPTLFVGNPAAEKRLLTRKQ